MRQRLRPVFGVCSRAVRRLITRLQKKEGMNMKVLLTEDDDKLRTELARFFKMHGYDTGEITDYKNAVEKICCAGGDILLLDLSLPDADEKYICKELRKRLAIPIVIITSQNTEMNELLCLNYGADDFIAKPFNPQILLAHVEAVLKRSQGSLQETEEVSCGAFILDISRSVAKAGEQEADLTKNESRILYCLAKNMGKIVSRDVIINDLWDSELFVDDNTLTVNITRLRAKLESIGQKGVIHTKRGQGYLLE